ncbi:MAG: LamG domain-containing protein [Thermoguttaceae bacterium]
MKAAPGTLPAIVVMLAASLLARPAAGADLPPTAASPDPMPRVEDYTHMGWAEAFPAHDPAAPWLRVIQTGYYAMALDTQTLRIPHLGPVPGGVGYAAAAQGGDGIWHNLPPADLELTITTGGKTYRCTAGGPWSQFKGPRLIESGRFLQRADVTDLVFTAEDGAKLNIEARFETVAWPDRLTLLLAARPGLLPIPPGESCFGRIGGGFGLDGTNHMEIPHSPELDPEQFTLELWAFVPADYQASERTFPWLVCKNHHEQAEGNYGIVILGGRPQARLNIGGGRDNMFTADARSLLNTGAWNHLASSYDGQVLRLYHDGKLAGEQTVGRKRVAGREGLAFGRRQDNSGDGYHFRGVVDEIRFYDRALTPEEVRRRFQSPETLGDPRPIREWTFRADRSASPSRPVETWNDAALEIRLSGSKGNLTGRWELPRGQKWSSPDWHEASVAFDPVSFQTAEPAAVSVEAVELPKGSPRPVQYDVARGWHQVNLDGIEPVVPTGGQERQNDAIERVAILLSNPTGRQQTARLLLEKNAHGFRQRIGSAITGLSAVLRDADGFPTGIPVQLSKNWHNRPEGGVYAGMWFHGFTQVRLQPHSTLKLELAMVYGHWGGVAAASHAQLCLIGWGSNQLWSQSALGSWGESICYEPDQVQAECSILDVRPVMVRSMSGGEPWQWTNNVGGGDFFRLFDPGGKRIAHARTRTAYERHGPCWSEVTFAGRIGEGIEHSATASLTRTDDIVRGTYRLRLDVTRPVDFSRFVIFQIGADTYSYTGERMMAVGNEAGPVREWATQWGGDTYRTELLECKGRVPWISLHDAVPAGKRESGSPGHPGESGAWANRGIVIRQWKAVLGGKPAAPWVAEHGVHARGADTSTADILPPPGVTRLLPGDFVEATLEHVIVPRFAGDYYGPNEALRTALGQWENTWRMIHREAVSNDRRVEVKKGSLESLYPSVAVRTEGNAARLTLTGGLGYVPVTFTGLESPRVGKLLVDGRPVDQAVHSNDFWQTDYDPASRSWSRTYNLPVGADTSHTIALENQP